MAGLLAPAAVAALLALAFPRRVPRQPFHIHWWPAALAAFAIELVLYNPPIEEQAWAIVAGPWIWVVTKLVMIVVVVRNLRASGRFVAAWLVALLGLVLNTLVIAANDGYMPQSVEAATEVWGAARPVHRLETRLQNTRPMTTDTQLPWLADMFAQPPWLPRPNVISIGDLLLSLGIAGWTFQVVGPRRIDPVGGGIVGVPIGGIPIHAPARGFARRPARRQTSAPPTPGQLNPAFWARHGPWHD
ncbi:MAG TPA: DUF5317 domain-containing protein [Chloroflexota bacterium]